MRNVWMQLATTVLFAGSGLWAQSPAFEVTSVKMSAPREGGAFRPMSDAASVGLHTAPRSLTAGEMTLKRLIEMAYDVRDFQVIGGPTWLDKDRFDIVSKTATPASRTELLLMLRSLLTERFQLRFRREQKEAAVLAMRPVKEGVKFAESREGVTCSECRMRQAPLSDVAQLLSALISLPSRDPATGALIPHDAPPVVDQTGLTGLYDIAFRPEPDQDIFAEITRQLGLRLEPKKVMLDVLLIERAEKPSAN
jgi:uncharacterized protein (TIGR03435 family)